MNAKPKRKTRPKVVLPLARKKEIVVQKSGEEILIYNLKTNKAHSLNETAAMVWDHCDGTKSVADISSEISLQTKTSVSEELVWLALDQLDESELLASNLPDNRHFESRREIIKKVGMASMISLPLISTITAPKAVLAQSSCLPLNTCIPPGNICPPSCNGRRIEFLEHSSTNGSCTNILLANALNCSPAGFFSARDVEITNVI